MKGVMAAGEHALLELLAASHTGNTTAEFEQIVTDWVATAKHPKTGRLYTEMVYEPMLEVLAYLRANGFKTYIVSGGGVEFMRPWVERVYGIPPEQVIGSRVKMKYEVRDGVPVLARLAEVDLNDDKAGKVVGIQQAIGSTPPLWRLATPTGTSRCSSGPPPRPGRASASSSTILMPNASGPTTARRPSAASGVAWTRPRARGWIVVDMKQDWKSVWPPFRVGQ